VRSVVTDLAYFDIEDGAFLLREIAPGLGIEDVRRAMAAEMRVAPDVKEMQF
jgi:3-oxoacid CoA-transferase subunit B